MRLIIALALLVAPALAPATASAADLSEKSVNQYRSSCVQSCAQKQDRATCQRACRCMADELAEHWTQERYDKLAADLKNTPVKDRNDRALQQLAAYCYQQVSN